MATEAQNLSRLSPNVVVGDPDGACLSHRDRPPNKPPILPSLPTNYDLIMQNKPNFRKAKMNLNFYSQKDYENKPAFGVQKNKPKQSQFLYHLAPFIVYNCL